MDKSIYEQWTPHIITNVLTSTLRELYIFSQQSIFPIQNVGQQNIIVSMGKCNLDPAIAVNKKVGLG